MPHEKETPNREGKDKMERDREMFCLTKINKLKSNQTKKKKKKKNENYQLVKSVFILKSFIAIRMHVPHKGISNHTIGIV